MKSSNTKKNIKQIAKEEGLSEWAVRLIASSQFEGVAKVIRSGEPDNPDSFKGVRLNGFGLFRVIRTRFDKFKGREKYLQEKRDNHDRKRKSK